MKKIITTLFVLISLKDFAQNLNYYQWKGLDPGIFCSDTPSIPTSDPSCVIWQFTIDSSRNLFWIKGNFEGADTFNSPNIVGYNGSTFVPFPYLTINDTQYTNSYSSAMIIYNNDLIFTTETAIIKFDFNTQQFSVIGIFPSLSNGECFAVFNGDLYLGGDFYSIQDASGNWHGAYNIARWDGVNWSNVGQYGVYNPSAGGGVVYSMEVYNNKLYVGGTFEFADSVETWNIAAWNGLNWSCLCDGISHFGTNSNNNNHYAATVHDLELFQGNLYATGNFDSICNVKSKLAFTDGNGWNGTLYNHNGTHILQSFKNYLISFSWDGAPNIYYWDGIQSTPVDSGIDLNTMAYFQDTLYAGGAFGFSGNTAVFRLAKLVFDSSLIIGLGKELISGNNSIGIYPNPANETVTIVLRPAQHDIQEVVVSNLVGVQMIRLLRDYPRNEISIYVSSLPAGVYFISVLMSDGSIKVQKFVKQ